LKRLRAVRDIAPFSAYMYEMIAAKHRLLNKSVTATRPLRFLLVGEVGALQSLQDLAGPAFLGEPLEKTHVKM
jgi:hypothetical protein